MATKPPDFHSKTKKLLENSSKQKARSICFFNNKGGVGKTTLVANLAAELALNVGQKILVIDVDPQCNLTQYLLDDEQFDATYRTDAPTKTVFDIINPLSMGKGYSRDVLNNSDS